MKRRVNDITADANHIYYNIELVNNTNKAVPCQYQENLTAPIITNGKDYELATVRFVIDGITIPLFFFDDGTYYVALSWNGFSEKTAVAYTPNQSVNGQQTVYSYTAFLQMINTAYATCITALNVASGGTLAAAFPSLLPPYMIYNNQTGMCSLLARTEYTSVGGFPIKVFMNNKLYNFFSNFYINFNGEDNANKQDYEIIIKDLLTTNSRATNLTVPANYLQMDQEFVSLYNWFDIKTIVFVSNTLGVNGEFTSNVNSTNSLANTSSNAGNGPPSTNMITDFAPYYSPDDRSGPRGQLYYTPTSEYRIVDINKDNISQIDLNIFLRDRTGRQYIYYCPVNQTITVKMLFRKKKC